MSTVIQRNVIEQAVGQEGHNKTTTGNIPLLPYHPESMLLLSNFTPVEMMGEPKEQQEQFLKALFGRCTFGCIEIRPIPYDENDRQWLPCNTTSIPNLPPNKNIFIGVATRQENQGRKDFLVQIPAVWVDVDPKNDTTIAKTKKLLDEFQLKPSIQVNSGHGLHAYWLLENPARPTDITRIEDINLRLAQYFDGDTGACDASRILRLPGTMNIKDNPPCQARLLDSDAGRVYRLEDFDFLLPQQPKPTQPAFTGQDGWLYPVSEGKRHTRATEIAGHFIGKNLPIEDVREILTLWNNGNNSQLPEKELFRIIDDFHKTRIAERGISVPKQGNALIGNATIPTDLLLDQCVVNIHDLIGMDIKGNDPILKPWLNEGDLVLISADTGVGKTWLSMSIAMAVTHDFQLMPWEVVKNIGCLYIDGEMTAFELQRRSLNLLKSASSEKAPFDFLTADIMRRNLLTTPNLSDPKFRDWLSDYFTSRDEYKVVFLDNLVSLTPSIDENVKKDWDPINQWLLSLRSLGMTVIMIHHTGKSGDQRGTSARKDNIDTSINLSRPKGYLPDQDVRFILSFDKARSLYGEDKGSLLMQLEICSAGVAWKIEKNKVDLKRQILSLLDSGIQQNQIANKVDRTAQYISQVRQKAIKDGILDAKGRFTEIGKEQYLNIDETVKNEEPDDENALPETKVANMG